MAITVAMRTQVSQLYVSLFGRAPDTEGLGFWVTALAGGMTMAEVAQSMYDTTPARAYYPAFATNQEIISTFYKNVLGRAADAEGLAFWTAKLDAATSKGAVFAELINNVVTYTGTDAAGLKSAALFANKVTVAQYFGETVGTVSAATTALTGVTEDAATVTTAKAAIDAAATPVVPAQTFTLTTDLNNFAGGAGNDTFNAPNTTATAANATLTTGDTLNGGAGTDTLNITGSVAGSTVTLSNVSNIENINLTDTTGVTVALTGSTGVTNVSSNGSTTAPTFTGIASTAVGLNVSNSAVGATFTFTTAAVAGIADTATLTLNGQTAGTNVVAGVETLNIVSAGSANAVTAITAANTTKINTSGSQTLNLATLPATTLSVDSSASTAAVTYIVPNNATAATLVGGAGNDSVTMTGGTAVNDNISLGDGNDTITFTANLANTDSVDGGAGTDKLVGTSAELRGLTIATPSAPILKNFETLALSDALGANTLTTANVQSGISAVELQVAPGGAGTVVFQAGDRTLTQTAAQGHALTVNDTGSATTDTLTLNIAPAVGAVNVLANALTIGGFETVTINTSTAGTLTKTSQTLTTIGATPDTGGAQTIRFVGDNTVTTGVITITGATSGTVDASGLTGTRTFTNVGATVGVTNIIGTANADTIVGSATATTIDGGAGNDNITGGAAADNVTAGAGNDTVTGGGGNDTLSGGDGNDSITQGAAGTTTVIDGGAGNDTLTLTGMLASGQKIDGGDGTDTLVIGTADAATLAGLTFAANTTFINNLKNVERVNFADALTTNPDMSRLGSINYVQIAANNGGGDSITGFADNATVETLIAQTGTTTFALATATGTNDTINLIYTGATGVGAAAYGATTTGIENVKITHNDADTTATGATADAAATITLADLQAKTITLDGNGLSTTLTLTGNTAITSISSASYAGALTVTSVSTVASTITGGSGADVITGGTKADSISGGSGSDTLAGGLGADTLDGGSGTNVLDASGMVAVTDAGNTASSGAIINLSATAITSGEASGRFVSGGTAVSFISGALGEIGAGKAGYLFATNAAGASSFVDTISNFTRVTGTTGGDYIAGNATGAQTITGGTGADFMVGGSGADTFVIAAGASVARTAETITEAAVGAGETITFGNGVDVISGFTSGTDKLDVATAANYGLISVAADVQALTVGNNYSIRGTYVESTGVFTQAAAGADSLVFTNLANAGLTNALNTAAVVLLGVTTLTTADFI